MVSVLLVDDDTVLRRMLRLALEAEGHKIQEAGDGAEALDLFRRGSYDIVVTDILMPETDGLELLIAVRREAPERPVIAISTSGQRKLDMMLSVAAKLGATTLEKPFAPSDLAEAVRRCVEK